MEIFFHSGGGQEPATAGAFADDKLIAALVSYERRARLIRGEIFDENVIDDSSWPLLQNLFAAYLEGEQLRTKQLSATSRLPQTTVLRYLDHLEKLDVVRREDNPEDRRVTLVSVTEAAAFWVREYYTEVINAERKLATTNEGVFALAKEIAQKKLRDE
jgi:DNA-binding MarR family transcriptional regulator